MHIDKAKQLKVGDYVGCPSDRGEPGYTAVVRSDPVQQTFYSDTGVAYIWVYVTGPNGTSHVWPSNRLE